jgi:hypothetical protein
MLLAFRSLHRALLGGAARRAAASVCAALLLALAAAGPARAEIVWSKGYEIWAMHDDGSAQRKLVAPADVGMTRLRDPMPAPSGATLAFTGETDANRFTIIGTCGTFPLWSCPTTHYGLNSSGTYRWAGGAITRISGAPAYCSDCTSTNSQPAPRADGSIVDEFTMCQGWLDGGIGGGQFYSCSAGIKATSGEVYDSCTTVSGVSPNPANGGQVAHVGCQSTGLYAVIATGPSRAGEHVVGCDDAEQADPTWTRAGDRVLVSEIGANPGLWSYPVTNDGCSGEERRVLVAPSGVRFDDPAFIAADRIVFAYDHNLWTIPASCDLCAFPAAATQLTTDGTEGQPNLDPAWTSDALVVTTTGGSGGGSAGGGGGAPSDTTAPSVQLRKTASTQRVGSSRRITLKVVPSEAATVRITGKIVAPGKDPVLTGGPVQAPAGATTTVKLKLGTSAMKALKRAWRAHRTLKAKLTITVTDAAGNATTAARTITLRR